MHYNIVAFAVTATEPVEGTFEKIFFAILMTVILGGLLWWKQRTYNSK